MKAFQAGDDLDYWEHRLERTVAEDTKIPETDREALIRARRGQGLFKQRVMEIESKCRITGVTNLVHLLASHCKTWRDSTNEERLNGENGLLLTPTIDHLFDRGFIGFEDSGELIISPVAHHPSLQRMGVETGRLINVGGGQRKFLEFSPAFSAAQGESLTYGIHEMSHPPHIAPVLCREGGEF